MKTWIRKITMGITCGILLVPGWASASTITLDDFLTDTDGAVFMEFSVIEGGGLPNSTPGDLATLDLALAISVSDDLQTVFFEFVNRSSSSSSVAEIYFDQGGQSIMENGSVFETLGAVQYEVGDVRPPNLPSGNTLTPRFDADSPLSAEASGNNATGLSTGENLVLAYDLLDLSSLASGLENNSFRIGIHVRSIGQGGESDAFVTNPMDPPLNPNSPQAPIPEPTTLLLLGMGSTMLMARKRFL